ncbi:predicted protein [Sclerotinia sclerotiorum 1980 UF-70]|uniref:Uncharacterized protein n=1 Tax=Sclerotinia sclerotiorum (strain ATCC 18683 / 1980 / Ss-1) TaxID=665079 RepID=A7F411_SCLS1|nr:predicted protein [Sclerotinia sclerotiorum 1980 UF-70]EDN97482.1 predicted protein [Sclerotinia sclerotiorum 1980 UF-70]
MNAAFAPSMVFSKKTASEVLVKRSSVHLLLEKRKVGNAIIGAPETMEATSIVNEDAGNIKPPANDGHVLMQRKSTMHNFYHSTYSGICCGSVMTGGIYDTMAPNWFC